MAKKTKEQQMIDYVLQKQPSRIRLHLTIPISTEAISEFLSKEESANLEQIADLESQYLIKEVQAEEIKEQHKLGFRAYKAAYRLQLASAITGISVTMLTDNFLITTVCYGITLSALTAGTAIALKTKIRTYKKLKAEAEQLEPKIKELQYTPEYAQTITKLEAHSMMTNHRAQL